MALLIVSFLAGIITVTAPCTVTLLPVIVGGTTVRASDGLRSRWTRPLIIVGSLGLSVVLFTLLLRGTTALLGVPQAVWQGLSGATVALFGASLIFPSAWDRLMAITRVQRRTSKNVEVSAGTHGVRGDVLLGAALGPVFNSCSPTYALVVATVLPASFIHGIGYVLAYALGLSLALLVLAVTGQSLIRRLGWLRNPHGYFRRAIGILLIVVGVGVTVGLDRAFQTFVLDSGLYDRILEMEKRLNL